jgi:hypothetical protein
LITLGSPPKKGGQKKTLVLTLGSPPEKGGKKKNSASSATENAARTSPAGEGQKKKKKQCRFCHGTSSDGQTGSATERHVGRTDRLSDLIYKMWMESTKHIIDVLLQYLYHFGNKLWNN